MDGAVGDVDAEVIGGSVGGAGLDAAAGHPAGETLGVVVAAVAALGVVDAAEFPAPDDQGVFHQAALFQVGEGLANSTTESGENHQDDQGLPERIQASS